MNWKALFAFLFAALVLGAAEPVTHWDFTKPQPDWGKPRGLSTSQEAEGLRLKISAFDSSIANSKLQIDTSKFARVRIVYRADELPKGGTNGELFFGGLDGSLKDHARFAIPSLVADGEWHEISLDIHKNIPYGIENWLDYKTIGIVRLDIMNEFPASVLLRSIEFLPPAEREVTSIAELNLERGWLLTRAMFQKNVLTARLAQEPLRLWARANHSAKILDSLSRLQIQGATVQKEANLVVEDGWIFLGIVKSGDNPVVFTLPETPDSDFIGFVLTPELQKPAFRDFGIPKQVEVQMPDKPAVYKSNLVLDNKAPYWTAKMVNIKGVRAENGSSFIRRSFEVRDGAQEAFLQLTADDAVKNVWLNGTKVEGVEWTESWKEVSHVDLTKLLRKGKNMLGIEYYNVSNVGGLLFELAVNYPNRKCDVIRSDAKCRGAFKTAPEGWLLPDFDEKKLSDLEEHPCPPATPWTVRLDYVDKNPGKGVCKVTSLEPIAPIVNASDIAFRVKFSCNPALKEDDVLAIELRSEAGKSITVQSRTIAELKPKQLADGSLDAVIGGFQLPRYGASYKVVAASNLYRWQMTGNTTYAFQMPDRFAEGGPEPLVSVKVEGKDAYNRLMVNGKPFYPRFLSVFYERSATGLEGEDSPVNIREFPVGGMANEWWLGMGQYDFSQVDARFDKAMREYPGAYIAIWIWCAPPTWYTKLYPERISRNFDGTHFEYYVAPTTFSDKDYRADVCEALRVFINYCEKYYGKRIIAYNLCGGVSFEWQGWGCHSLAQKKTLADYSPAAKRDYLAFMKANYPQLKVTEIPTYEERFSSDHILFRNPAKDAAAIAYDEYYANSIADTITIFAKRVKELSGHRKLVGCYYGYLFEYGNMGYCINSSGHNAVARLLDSPDLDFLLSPPSYAIRPIGEPGADMKPFASINRHRKFSILEDDTRTNASIWDGYHQTVNPWQTKMVLQRNYGMALSRRTPICHLPIVEGIDVGQRRDTLQRAALVGQKIYEENIPYQAEVAFVVDETSNKYLEPNAAFFTTSTLPLRTYSKKGYLNEAPRYSQKLTGELVAQQRYNMGKFGAAHDCLLLSDVEECAGQYKMLVFLNVYKDSLLARRAMKAALEQCPNVVIAYGYGFLGEQGVDASGMEKLFGIQMTQVSRGLLNVTVSDFSAEPGLSLRSPVFGTEYKFEPRFAVADSGAKVLGTYSDTGEAALAVKQVGKAQVWFCGSNVLTPELLHGLAAASGVHLYTAPGDVLFAGCGTITVHAATKGTKTVQLKEKADAVDMYSGEILAKNVKSLQLPMKAHETRTLLIGDAGKILSWLK